MILKPVIQGGLPQGTSIALVGPPGTGKTLFCLQLALEAIREGRNALFLSTENSPQTIIAHALDIGLLSPDEAKDPKIKFIDAYSWRIGSTLDSYAVSRVSNPGNLNEVNLLVIEQVKESAPGSIIIIDSVSGLNLASPDRDRIRIFVHVIAQRISTLGKQLILVLEEQAHDSKLIANLRALVQGTIFTRNSEQMNGNIQRELRVHSLVGQNIETKWCQVIIKKDGMRLAEVASNE